MLEVRGWRFEAGRRTMDEGRKGKKGAEPSAVRGLRLEAKNE